MKKKIFYFSIFLLFALFLSGCCPDTIGITEKEKVENVIGGFWSAIDQEDWFTAGLYCHGNAVDTFVDPYRQAYEATLAAYCSDLIVDVYYDIINISFPDVYTAVADIQVNTWTSGCGHSNERDQFGTMEIRLYLGKWLVYSVDLK